MSGSFIDRSPSALCGRFVEMRKGIVGSGPIAGFDPELIPEKAFVIDSTTGELYQCVYSFLNDGTDFIDCGRPATVISALAPTKASTVRMLVRVNDLSSPGYFWSIADTSANVQNGVYYLDNGGTVGRVGAIAAQQIQSTTISSGVYFLLTLFTDGVDGAWLSEGTGVVYTANKGTFATTYNLFIGGRTDGATTNAQNNVIAMDIHSGYNADGSVTGLSLVDCWNLSNGALWNGGGTGYSKNGNVFTVTDGTPVGCRKKTLVKCSLLNQMKLC